ncbi:MAG: methylenetetrahydrofolate reductase [NAD(P)H] [Planctomycetota bacterium]
MRIRDLFNRPDPVISFEFFPPKTDEGASQLFKTIQELQPLRPSFVSVTYGAGGSTRKKTLEVVTRIKQETGIEVMAHLTCVGSGREEIKRVLERLIASGVENVLALRGDPPSGSSEFVPPKDGFAHASDLVGFIRSLEAPLCLAGACYPERHPEARDLASDLEHLKLKADAGVDFLISQLFFDNDDFFYFVRRAREIGIGVPIVPGIMPITNYAQVQRFTQMCGARIPEGLRLGLEAVQDSAEAVAGLGVSYATDQCRDLLKRGSSGLHFYTLNRSPATRAIHARVFLRGR